MKFPRKAWMPFCITPQQNLLNHLFRRRFLKLRAAGMAAHQAGLEAGIYTDKCEVKYNLIDETNRLKLSLREWDAYVGMNCREKIKFEREMAIFC